LKLYRGWATPEELAKKAGLGSPERVLVAAQELAGKGLSLIERGLVKLTTRLMEARPGSRCTVLPHLTPIALAVIK